MFTSSSAPPAKNRAGRASWRRTATVVGLAASCAAALITATAGTASATTGCSVTYTTITNWGSGFQAQVAITPGAAVTGWSLTYDVADKQVVAFATSAVVGQSGVHVTLNNAVFNGNLAAGSSVTSTVGVNTNPTGTNVPPAKFVLNGQTCAYTPQPYVVASAFRPTVAEGGSTTMTVRLSQAPAVNTVLRLPNATGGLVTASPASLTFTSANWNVPQTITISSGQDSDTINQTYYLPIQQQNWTPPLTFVSAVPIVTQIDNG